MATEAIPQLLDTSVDSAGLSVVSATMTAANPRHGSMYNPATLAAGVPMWFHALQDGRYVALFQSYWNAATVGAAGPQSYTHHSEIAAPGWVIVAPPTGNTGAMTPIPTRFPGPALALNAAVSRVDYLFTVGRLGSSALIQHHRVTPQGVLVLAGEELLAAADGVVFDRGCCLESDQLVVFGADAYGVVYQAQRPWARIGASVSVSPWQYRGAKGWLPDPTNLEPIGLSSAGPVSVLKSQDRRLVSVVSGDQYTGFFGQVYTARLTDPFGVWKPLGAALALGDATSYLGGTLYFQPQLARNPAVTLPDGASTGIPYVSSVRVISGVEQSINTAWGLWSL